MMRLLYLLTGLVLLGIGTLVAIVMLAPMWIAVAIYWLSEQVHDYAVDLMNEAADMLGVAFGVDDDNPFSH